MARVTRISTRQASVEIICVGETVLREPHRGIVRKEVGGAIVMARWVVGGCFRAMYHATTLFWRLVYSQYYRRV